MIYFGPQDAQYTEPLAQELPLNEVLIRSAAEIDHLKDAVAVLEEMVVSNMTLMEDNEVRKALQAIDPIKQSLEALAKFMSSIADEPCRGPTPVANALYAVHLEAVRKRLGRVL